MQQVIERNRDVANLERTEFATHMDPRDFVKEYPVNHSDMAKICCCSEDTVRHWFVEGPTRREPREHHKVLLAYTYHAWKTRDAEPIYSREIYEKLQKSKQNKPD